MSSSPSPSTPTNDNTFLNAAYRNISADPDKSKISRLMSHVNTHALTQHMPAFPGYWMMQTDPVDITQYVRLDQVTGEGGKTESGIRGRLKGNYPRTKSIKAREDQEKQTEDEGLGTGVITELKDIGAYIIPIEERDSTITNSDSKSTNKKKKNSKKNKKKKGKKSITSSTNTVEEEEEEEAEGRDDQEKQKKDASDVDVVLGSDSEASGDEGKKTSVAEEEATEIIAKDDNFQGGDDDTQTATRVLSPPSEPAQPEGKEESTSINLDTQVPSQRADDIVPSTSTSPIKVRLPPPSTPPSQPRRLENNIIYFGEIPTRYFNSAEQEPLSRSNSTEEGDINTPIIGSLDSFSHTPESITPRQGPSPSSSMSNPTPPQSPPMGEENTHSSTSININRIIYSEPSSVNTVERPLTPPPEVEDDEEDGKLVFPSDPPQATQPHIISRSLVNPPPIPSITLNTPTSPAMFTPTFHPLTHSWTMYFSNTAHQHQRKVSMPALSPLNPLSSHPNASDYSSHLVTLFKADNLEDLLGGWKALRRSIAKSKMREIEPVGESVQKGGSGLGTHLFQEETNFHIFKSHIRPMWEDRYCQKGGKIMIAGEASAMDDLFLELIFLLISGDLEDEVPPPPGSSSMICGLVLSRRKLTRIEMWLCGENVMPDKRWVEQVTKYIQVNFKDWRVYPYKAFGKS
ncbi:hypothetical protein V865_008068 [Kwoniella europaea PYCC6329]|uniref:Translation initiation factor 4E n=1 Tax=Kwoniella europaea PYCC6329 TaxID=1423913 RepID=A0AAX4KX28_9TREE